MRGFPIQEVTVKGRLFAAALVLGFYVSGSVATAQGLNAPAALAELTRRLDGRSHKCFSLAPRYLKFNDSTDSEILSRIMSYDYEVLGLYLGTQGSGPLPADIAKRYTAVKTLFDATRSALAAHPDPARVAPFITEWETMRPILTAIAPYIPSRAVARITRFSRVYPY
jgi:hypothetical protein